MSTHLKRLPLLLLALFAMAATAQDYDAVLWPEQQRAFLQDAPGLLLDREQREAFLTASEEERQRILEEFLASDPLPETEENELTEGIARRMRLVRQEYLSLLDHRARLLFLNGAPTRRDIVDCGQTFQPIELWTFGAPESGTQLVVYRPEGQTTWRLWVPTESKRVLYNKEMEYWLEQWEELKGFITGKRFDLQVCADAKKVDEATGIEGLRRFRANRPRDEDILRFLAPPSDLTVWSQVASTTPVPEAPPELEIGEVEIFFPERVGQRLVSRLLISIPSASQLAVTDIEGAPGLGIAVEGVLEQQGSVFEDFRVRFRLEAPQSDEPIALVLERSLRPNLRFVVHLRVKDEGSGAEAYLSRGFEVPDQPQPMAQPPVPEGTIIAMGEQLSRDAIPGRDSLLLVPPPSEVVLGLWRAEALVTGTRIAKVSFLVDGQVQMTRNGRPFSAELRLAKFPVEQVVRAEGLDGGGELVAADEVVINQPRGALRVRILDPPRGASVSGHITVRAEVVVPEDRRVEHVEFKVNEQEVGRLERPPWEVEIDVPGGESMSYLSVTAVLDDDSRSEEVRFLNAPKYLEEVDVKLVELYTTVTDRSGRLVRGLTADRFEVREDGRLQTIAKFELVEDLPLTIGIVIDTSTSMADALAEAKQAALGFLENIITPRDKVFAVAFSDQPSLLFPPTDDVEAVEATLKEQVSTGNTALHDAIVTSLYYFRGVRGRRALVLLSDGDDTNSAMPYRDALEYARRSGVAIYSIGLGVGSLDVSVRKKLNELAEESGGQSFMISTAAELSGVYQQIEQELRSQYLVAYSSDRPTPDGTFRTVEVEVNGGKLKARTIRGYYP